MLPHHVDPTGPTATIDPVVAGSVVVAGARDGPIYAFDRITGALRWKAPPLPVVGGTTPALIRDVRPLATCDNRIFAGSTSRIVVALDPEDGREIWRTEASPWGGAAWVWCGDSTVFVFRPGGQLEAYDAATGRRRWGITEGYHFSFGGATDGNRLYVGGLYGLYALRNE
jgi:glucose dehydrogenase